MVGGLDVDLAIGSSLGSVVPRNPKKHLPRCHSTQAPEDTFLTPQTMERAHRDRVNGIDANQIVCQWNGRTPETGELVAHGRLVEGTHSLTNRGSADRPFGKRALDQPPDTRAHLIVTLLVSLGLGAVIWGAVASLASAVLR
jgi:hypothetical protein